MKTMTLSVLSVAFAAGVLASVPAQAKAIGLWAADAGSTAVVERRRPRVPGGSGCDDPRDIIEHPECR